MSSGTKTNGPGTGPTSRSAPGNDKSNKASPDNKESPDYDRALDPAVADDDLSDAEYLRRQGERAKAAIMGAAGAIKASAVGGAKGLAAGFKGSDAGDGSAAGSSGGDGQSGVAGAKAKAVGTVREHPWYALGGATAAGFLTAVYLNPSRFGRVKKRVKDLEARLAKQERLNKGRQDTHVATQEAAKDKAKKASLLTSLGTMAMGELVRNLKPLLTERLAPIMAGLGGQHQNAGGPDELTPEMIAALRERFGGQMPPGFDPRDMPPGYGYGGTQPGGPQAAGMHPGQMHPDEIHTGGMHTGGGNMPPGVGGQIPPGQKPPRAAGDPAI